MGTWKKEFFLIFLPFEADIVISVLLQKSQKVHGLPLKL
jgi:hypothetical protein